MPTFALLDVVTPYVVGGAAIGEPLHELLSALFVTEVETSFDDNGVCIAGIYFGEHAEHLRGDGDHGKAPVVFILLEKPLYDAPLLRGEVIAGKDCH